MRILAIDTSTMFQTVALVEGGQTLSECAGFVERGHTSSLLRSVDTCLREASAGVDDIDLVAVGLGPGSFTGIRIGVSSAKALCYGIKRPIVGVSSLAAIALGRQAPDGALVVTAIDARKKEVYAAAWELKNRDQIDAVIPPSTHKPTQLASELASLDCPLVGLGNGFALYAEIFESALGERLDCRPADEGWPRAIAIAKMGRRRFEEEGSDELAQLEPLYIRASDAELNWKKKRVVTVDADVET